MSSESESQEQALEEQQYPKMPPPGVRNQEPPKKGIGKIIAVVVVVVIVIIAVIAAALMMGPGIVGKWNVVSVKSTIFADGNETIVWDYPTDDWVEFKSDGTGINNNGDTFNWEASNGRITITDATNDAFGTMGVPFDYTLDGDDMTIRGMFATGLYMVITLERA